MTNPKHTTAEYLAWIDERIAKLNELINNPCAWGIETEIEYRASLLANRDVLVRHEPKRDAACDKECDPNDPTCIRRCKECPKTQVTDEDGFIAVLVYCPTYLDIAQRLDEVM